ncbi:MAG: type II toxin-antitoxin system RelE/ParE family toxin [Eggerthellaceae bacterium]|nr:type II toxin-antitoxin system RelE/ParE family toxin [Eggerthellaceae bacterium]
MVEGCLYDVYWTPDFTEDVMAAVAYIAEELESPIAARNLLDGVTELLDSKQAMPTAATSYKSPTGTTRYIASYKKWDVYYVVDGRTIKAISLKHQQQDGPRSALPRELP